jgi:hypothetical protein
VDSRNNKCKPAKGNGTIASCNKSYNFKEAAKYKKKILAKQERDYEAEINRQE